MSEDKTRVLLVEDNVADARLMRELLRDVPRCPFELTVAGTLGEAIATVAGHDVVLLDLSLPDAHGLATITRMSEAAAGAPVIVLTGNNDDEVALEAVQLGADDYLYKSEVTPSLIARTIMYAIERRRGLANERKVLALELSRAESVKSAERSRFLADLSAAFATTFELDVLVQTVCRGVVPYLADDCLVDVIGDGQNVERLSSESMPSEPPTTSLRRFYALGTQPSSSPVSMAMKERRAVDVTDVSSLFQRATGRTDERTSVMDLLAGSSGLVLPLVARDRVVGALTLLRLHGRPFDQDARELGEEVARRTAVAVDNALLYFDTQRAIAARDELLAIVSHDLRNPLAVFALTLQAVRRALEAGSTPPFELIRRGTRAIGRMEGLISELLDVARIDAGTFAVTRAPQDVALIVREVVEQNLTLAVQKEVRLEANATGHITAMADRERVFQALTNLVANAIKFTPAGGDIIVSCIALESAVECSVRDTGPGIQPDSLPHVFDRFYQSTRRQGGVGLGLAIVKGIVEAHGGTLGVDSAPGRGARFWFQLPTAVYESSEATG